jgi:hypothetical protein
MLVSFHQCPQTRFISLTPSLLCDLRSWLCVICLPKLHNYMVQCPLSSFLHIYHCEQLVQNYPFIKLDVLMEIPYLWL